MSDPSEAPAPPTVPTPVADYRALRLMAESAFALRERELRFTLHDGSVRVAEPGRREPPAGATLVVPGLTPGRYGAVRSLEVRAAGARSPNLVALGVDALFWSEAAVEKFLLPYYASCAGSGAARFLDGLLDAWNGDHGTAAPVALAHLARPPEGAPLSFEETVGVLFLDRSAEPRLELLPLSAFRARHPGRWNPEAGGPAAVVEEGVRILPEGGRLPHAPDLRGLAEWASSMRTRTAYLEYDPEPPRGDDGEDARVGRLPGPGPNPSRTIVIPVFTPPAVPARPPLQAVLLEPERGRPLDLLLHPRSDAVFTSTGAMEQFLFPYYAGVRGARALPELGAMYEAWWGAVRRGEDASPGDALALVHLPKSDWDALEEGAPFVAGSPLDQVGVVSPGEEGLPRVLTVRQARREAPG